MAEIIAPVAWLARADWPEWKRLDPEGLQATYDEWLQAAQAGVEQLKRDGVPVEPIPLDPKECLAWCQANGMKVQSQGRARYAMFVASNRRRN